MTNITINIDRVEHLMKLYKLTREDIVLHVNKGLKRALSPNEIFTSQPKISILKKIDSIFNRGINYYLDPKNIKESKDESIFFRKDHFNAELSLGAKQIVTRFEEEKIAFSALAKLSNISLTRKLPFYTVSNNPKTVASELRKIVYPGKPKDIRKFLQKFIELLAEHNITVFEFVETHNKTNKANINGFFLSPNTVVLKRIQTSLRREVFTLAHELGHYLLNIEEIDNISDDDIESASLNTIEKWCNDFAWYFLAGDYSSIVDNLEIANKNNDYHHDTITQIALNTPLSTIAIYTRLVISNKISQNNYNLVKEQIFKEIKERDEERKKQQALDIARGKKPGGSTPKPILSPLVIKTVQSAFYEGVIGEREFCKHLNIKPENINKFLL